MMRRRIKQGGDHVDRESLMVSTLVELADNLVDNFDIIDILTLLCDRCVKAFSVDTAGFMLEAPGDTLQFVASSSESMRVLELFQIQAWEGPCVDCFTSGSAIVNHDLIEPDEHWPKFTPRAIGLGFRAVHCLPMGLRGRTIGALNFFQSQPGSVPADDILVAQGLADIATIAILQHRTTLDARRLNDQLAFALNSRITIEQAKGMIAQSSSADMDVAFARLRAHARNHNWRLTDVANRVVEGSLPISSLDYPTGDDPS